MRKLRGEAIIEWKNEEMHKLYLTKIPAEPAPKAPGALADRDWARQLILAA